MAQHPPPQLGAAAADAPGDLVIAKRVLDARLHYECFALWELVWCVVTRCSSSHCSRENSHQKAICAAKNGMVSTTELKDPSPNYLYVVPPCSTPPPSTRGTCSAQPATKGRTLIK